MELGELQDAEARVSEAVALSRERDDKAALSWATQVQGLLRTKLQAWDPAERSFEEAERLNAEMESWTSWAVAHADHAELYLARREPGDLDRGRGMLQEALARFEEFGMDGRAEEARQRLKELEG